MHEKTKLLGSMANLINHITKSQANQQQIFNTFNKPDLSKILSNLQDQNQNVRKTTLSLITFLLHNNKNIQQNFCKLMEIPFIEGKIILNMKTFVSAQNRNDYTKIKTILKKIKEPLIQSMFDHRVDDSRVFYWYIDTTLQEIYINYVRSSEIQVDPKLCIMGVIINTIKYRPKSPQVFKPKFFSPKKVPIQNRQTQPNYFSKKINEQQRFIPSNKLNKTFQVNNKRHLKQKTDEKKHSDSFSSSHYTSNQSNRQLTNSFQDPPRDIINYTHSIQRVTSINHNHQPIIIKNNPNNSFQHLKHPQIKYIKKQQQQIPNNSRQSYPVAGPHGNINFNINQPYKNPVFKGIVNFQHK